MSIEEENKKGETTPEETEKTEDTTLPTEEVAEPQPGEAEPESAPESGESPQPEPEETIRPEFEVAGSPKLSTFFVAVRDVMLNPSEFFGTLTLKNGIGYPLAFGVAVSFINSLGSIFFSVLQIFLGMNFGLVDQIFSGAFSIVMTPLFALFFAPVIFLVMAIIYHVLLITFKFDSAGFEGTVRVVCYSTAPLVLGIIPFCGGLVGFVWNIVATVVGFQMVCRMSTGWAIFIYLIPLLLLCTCFAGVLGIGGMAILMNLFPELQNLDQFTQHV